MKTRLTLLFVVLAVFAFASFGYTEEQENAAEVLNCNPSLFPQNLLEIERIYLSFPEKPVLVKVERNSYYIWALYNFFAEKARNDFKPEEMKKCTTPQSAFQRYTKDLEDMLVVLEEKEPAIRAITEIVLNFGYIAFLEYAYTDRSDGFKVRNEFKKGMRAYLATWATDDKRELLKHPAIRESLQILSSLKAEKLVEQSQELSRSDLFFMANMEICPNTNPSTPIDERYSEKTVFPVPSLDKSGYKEDNGKIKIAGYFHALTNTGTSTTRFMVADRRFRNQCIQVPGEYMGWHYFSCGFLEKVYCSDYESDENIKALNGQLKFWNMPWSKISADHRKVYVETECAISRDITRLVDPQDPAYCYMIDLMVTNDHAEYPNGRSVIRALQEYAPQEVAKYNEYLKESEVFLVARYPRTIDTTFTIQSRGYKHTYRTPDYTSMPEFYPVYIPRDWGRYVAYLGPARVLFSMNLIGLGDRTLHITDIDDKKDQKEEEKHRVWAEEKAQKLAAQLARVNPTGEPKSIEEIEFTYNHLKTENVNGHITRGSYLVWALCHYLRAKTDAALEEMVEPCANVAAFKESILADELEALGRIEEQGTHNPLIIKIALEGAIKHYKSRYDFRKGRVESGNFACTLNKLELCSGDGYKDPAVREIFAVMNGYSSYSKARTTRTVEEGGAAMFVLADMCHRPIMMRKDAKTPEDIERAHFSFPPLATADFAGGVENEIAVNAIFHPLICFEGKLPGTISQTGKPSGGMGYIVGGGALASYSWIFRSEQFLRTPYAPNIPERYDPYKRYEWFSKQTESGNSLYADQRAIMVDREFVVSRELKRLCDPNDRAYTKLFETMLMNRHPGHKSGLEILAALAADSPETLKTIQDYINRCEVFLVAEYPKSVKITHNAVVEKRVYFSQKSCTYFTPDFRDKPRYHLLYVPRLDLRHTSYTGVLKGSMEPQKE